MPHLPDRLETRRLVLRKPRAEDAPPIFVGWAQDAQVTRYLTWRPHESAAQTESFVAQAIDAWRGDERAVYVITTRERDVPIGLIEARLESEFAASVGYVLQRSEWNRGYMTKACRALLDRLSTLPHIWRIWASSDLENGASARVLEVPRYGGPARLGDRFVLDHAYWIATDRSRMAEGHLPTSPT